MGWLALGQVVTIPPVIHGWLGGQNLGKYHHLLLQQRHRAGASSQTWAKDGEALHAHPSHSQSSPCVYLQTKLPSVSGLCPLCVRKLPDPAQSTFLAVPLPSPRLRSPAPVSSPLWAKSTPPCLHLIFAACLCFHLIRRTLGPNRQQ